MPQRAQANGTLVEGDNFPDWSRQIHHNYGFFTSSPADDIGTGKLVWMDNIGVKLHVL